MASKKIKLTSQTAWETQKDLNENFADIDSRLDAVPTKTSDLTNDGDGTSNFATESYVNQYGGKIDSISVNGTPQTIDANKNVNLVIDNNNQTVKAGNVTFGANDVVEIEAGSNVTVTGDASTKKITIASSYTDTGATSVESTGNGNAVTSASYDSATRKITLTKGETFQTATDNSLDTTSKTVSGAINEVNSIAKQANQAKGFATYQALITELNSASATKYNVGQSFYIQTKNVPDIWVMSIESTSVPYTYTTDAAFITATGADGGQQVGYYKLAQLETQKVDLTNYVQKSTTIAGVDLQDNITKSELLTALNVADGAEVNVQADWNQTDTNADDYIKNKPTIPTDTNQKVSAKDSSNNDVTFGDNDTVKVVAGSNVQVVADGTAKTITVSATDTTYQAGHNITITSNTIAYDNSGDIYSVGILSLLSQQDAQSFLTYAFSVDAVGVIGHTYDLASSISLSTLAGKEIFEIDFSAVSSLIQTDNFVLQLKKTTAPKTSSDTAVPIAYSGSYSIYDQTSSHWSTYIVSITGIGAAQTLSLTAIGEISNTFEDISFTSSDAGWSSVDANGFYTLTITSAKKPIAVYNTSGEQVLAGLKYDGTYIYVITDTKFAGVVTAR